jgi:hypothetical protein
MSDGTSRSELEGQVKCLQSQLQEIDVKRAALVERLNTTIEQLRFIARVQMERAKCTETNS